MKACVLSGLKGEATQLEAGRVFASIDLGFSETRWLAAHKWVNDSIYQASKCLAGMTASARYRARSIFLIISRSCCTDCYLDICIFVVRRHYKSDEGN